MSSQRSASAPDSRNHQIRSDEIYGSLGIFVITCTPNRGNSRRAKFTRKIESEVE